MSSTHADAHDHPPFLAHHWETPKQQFEAGKLGMWLFLATEFLLFGGLFCLYAVKRFNNPELFAYGSQFLDTKWGAINTVVLIASSLTMAMGVTAAQLGKRKLLVTLLGLTFLGGLGFMCIKYVEYNAKFAHNAVWGKGFYEPVAHGDEHVSNATHAETVEGVVMAGGAHAEMVDGVVDEVMVDEALAPSVNIEGLELTMSSVPPAAKAPSGLAPASPEHHTGHTHSADHVPNQLTDLTRPANAHIFFGIYFLMTGLHGIHVLVGMIVIAWLMWKSAKGTFGPEYFTPVDLGGLYWHVVDMIWIFLFPLLYLI